MAGGRGWYASRPDGHRLTGTLTKLRTFLHSHLLLSYAEKVASLRVLDGNYIIELRTDFRPSTSSSISHFYIITTGTDSLHPAQASYKDSIPRQEGHADRKSEDIPETLYSP